MKSLLRACVTTTVGLTALAVAQPAATLLQDSKPTAELSQAQTDLKVKADLARQLRLRAEDVRIVESAPRTWPDMGLGCTARRGVFDPIEVPGFRIVAEAGARRFVYHSDRHGRLLRCPTAYKPLDPIK